MRSRISSATSPRERHQPAIAKIDLALDVARVLLLADRDQPMPVGDQPAVAGRICGAKAKHRDARMMVDRAAQPLERFGGDQRRVAEDHQNVVGAFGDRLRARQAPHARCRAARSARTPAPSASTRRASSATASRIGPDHDGAACRCRRRARRASTCASSDGPATSCSTFGRAERMRVPSPAASTIARQVRLLIGDLGDSRRHTAASSLGERWKAGTERVELRRESAGFCYRFQRS